MSIIVKLQNLVPIRIKYFTVLCFILGQFNVKGIKLHTFLGRFGDLRFIKSAFAGDITLFTHSK